MTTADIKQQLVSRIWDTENLNLLKEMMQLFKIEDEAVKLVLTPEQITAIRKGQEDIRAGRTFSDKDADSEMRNG